MQRRHHSTRHRFGALLLVGGCSLFSCAVLSSTARLSAAEPDPKAAERAAKDAAEAQRRQQIEQHAKQGFEPGLNTFMDGELELVRKTCGSLSPAARREILAAGKKAVASAAKQLADWQFGDQKGKPVDSKGTVLEAIHAAVKPHATAEEFAAYERERAARLARRDRAARASIVAKLDDGLHLSIAQRAAIALDLEKSWDEAWRMEIGDRGMKINGRGTAPDFADRCIVPHLDSRQRAEWKTWREQAGWSKFGIHHQFANQRHSFGIIHAEPDPWWTP